MRPSQLQYNLNSVTRDNVNNGCLDGSSGRRSTSSMYLPTVIWGEGGGGDLSWEEIGPYHLVMWASQDLVWGLSS